MAGERPARRGDGSVRQVQGRRRAAGALYHHERPTTELVLQALRKTKTAGGIEVPDVAQVDAAFGILLDIGEADSEAATWLRKHFEGNQQIHQCTVVLFNPMQGGTTYELTNDRGSFIVIDAEAISAFTTQGDAEALFGVSFPAVE